MATNGKKIDTMNQLQKLVPRLLEEHNGNKKLMKAALSNPILALEEIGYTLSSKVKEEIEERARFNEKQQKKRSQIKDKINGLVGKKVDLSSTASVTKALQYAIPGKTVSVGKKSVATTTIIKAASTKIEPQIFQKSSKKDPLNEFKSAHEMVPMLLEFRKIEASSPQLASKKTFTSLLKGKETKTGITISNVRFRLQERSKRKMSR